MGPIRYGVGWGGKGRVPCASPWAVRLRTRWRIYVEACACWEQDTLLQQLVQNPYVRLMDVPMGSQGLQGAEQLTGYLRTNLPLIVAGRPAVVAWRGIQSSGICLQLPDPCHQDTATGLDALGLVQRQQGVEAVGDLLDRQPACDQLVNFLVVQNL